jgi:hypothetical protein
MIQDRFARHRLNGKQIDVALKTIPDLLQAEEHIGFAYLHGSALELLNGEQGPEPRDIDVAIYLTGGDWMTIELELQHADFLERISNSFCRLAGFFEAAYA